MTKKIESKVELLNMRIINRIKRGYEKKGYKVIITPSGINVPDFLKNYQPDMIAISDKESVIIEVKSRLSLSKSKYFDNLAEVAKKNGWRFELNITSPKKDVFDSKYSRLSKEEIIKRLEEISKLKEMDYFDSAYILAWATLEAAIRITIKKDKLNIYNRNPLVLVKNLYSYGILNEYQYRNLENALKIRNSLVHGLKPKKIELEKINVLIDLIKELIN